MTKFFRGKSKKKEVKPEPRMFTEIQAEYVDLRAKAGELQYQLHVNTRGLEQLNRQLENLNYEAAERQKLDKATLKPEPANAKAPQSGAV